MSLENVLIDELRDLYSAENQLVKALPKMAKGSSTLELQELFTEHLEETKGHVNRLKHAFEVLGEKPTGETCKAMQGLVKEGEQQLNNDHEEGATKDVAIAGAALRVEHYEIAGYTAAIAIATSLGQDEIVALLTETLHEEEEAGKRVLAQARPLMEEASSGGDGIRSNVMEMESVAAPGGDVDDLEVEIDLEPEPEPEDESDEDAPARRAAGVGTHPTKRASR